LTVGASWLVVFRFEEGFAADVGHLDYYQECNTHADA